MTPKTLRERLELMAERGLFPRDDFGHAHPLAVQEIAALVAEARRELTFTRLRKANVARCEEVFHPITAWSLTDWATAAAGELGEACNVIKKMRRFEGSHNDPARNIDPESAEGKLMLGHEIAEVVIHQDLLAARAGIDLAGAVQEKFDLVSRREGSGIVLTLAAVLRAQEPA